MDFLFIQKVKTGDPQACKQFIQKYYPAIYQYCFLHVHNQYDAEDMTQETFTRFLHLLIAIKIAEKPKIIYIVLPEMSLKTITKKRKMYC